MLNIEPSHLKIVKEILRKYVPGAAALAYGSRVTGTAVAYSDLDLAVRADKKLDFSLLGNMEMDFEESILPFRVDVLDWNTASPEFRKIIEARHEVIELSAKGAESAIR